MSEIEQATKYFISIVEYDKVALTSETLERKPNERLDMIEIALKAFAGEEIDVIRRFKAMKFFKATIAFVELEILNNETDLQDNTQIELVELLELLEMSKIAMETLDKCRLNLYRLDKQ